MLVVVFDVETKGLDARKFVMGSVVYGRLGKEPEKRVFWDRKEMGDFIVNTAKGWVEKKEERVYVYAHNIQYDFISLFKDRLGEFDIFSTSPFLVGLKGSNKILFVDSMNIFKMSLKDLGDYIELEKGELPLEVLERYPNISEEERRKLVEYNIRDNLIVFKALSKLRETLGKVGFNTNKFISAGQIAVNTFINYIRKSGDWWKISDGKKIYKTRYEDFIRAGFRGGRCEAFKTGVFKATGLDINSLYPFVMFSMDMPNLKNEFYVNNVDWSLVENYIGFVRAEVELNYTDIGYLPINFAGYMVYPRVGKVKGIWSTIELLQAREKGAIKSIKFIDAVLYPKMKNVFQEYIFKLYELKKNAEGSEKLTYKLLLNSLFGKFGQRNRSKRSKVIHRSEAVSYLQKGWEIQGVIDEFYIIEKEEEREERYFVNPVISAWITANARVIINEWLSRVRYEDLIYTDTDSIILKNFERYKKVFSIGKEMGEWKIVFEDKRVIVLGEKKYAIIDEENERATIKVSGVRKMDLSLEDFMNGKLTTKRMLGLGNIGRISYDLLGSFIDVEVNLEERKKGDLPLPFVIEDEKLREVIV